MVREKAELLAPVGSMEALYAAVQNGADAVYLGGKVFNARQYASNFGPKELEEAIKYAHLNHTRVYVTVNILLDDRELEEAIDYIRFLYEIDVDGIIVQDIGLASLVRKIFPDLNIHASTQMTINNLYGAKHLEKMGFSRVVLARETPLEEIRKIKDNTKLELESFVHGALCISYSGQCLMSSLLGGRSGNRGRCAQPCRMQYSIVDRNGRIMPNWDKKYLLSPRDLNTMDHLEELIQSGITSLKVEGRMKRPEYVATIVSKYRKALDEGIKAINNRDRIDISQIFNRQFTKGIMLGDFGRSFISYDRPDNRGILIGKVVDIDKNKVYIKLEEDLNKGDGIELALEKGGYKGIKSPVDGKKGSLLQLYRVGRIKKDSLVYKTSSEELLVRARSSYEDNKKTYPLDMKVEIRIGQRPYIELKSGDYQVAYSLDILVEEGQRVELDKEKIIKQLSKLGDTNYYLAKIDIELEDGAYLAISALNNLRRGAVAKLNELVANYNKRKIDEEDFNRRKASYFSLNIKEDIKDEDRKLGILVKNRSQYEQLDKDKLDRLYLGFYHGIEDIIYDLKARNKEVYIWTDKILYSSDLERLKAVISQFEDKIDGVSVSNLGSLEFFRENFHLNIHGDIGLNIFNSFALRYFNSLGLKSLTLSPELNLEQIKNLKYKENIEAIVYGYLPLMIMKTCPMALVKGCKDDRACETCNFAKGYGLKDRMGINFYMERNDGSTTIYNSVPIMVLDSLKSIVEAGVKSLRLDFTQEEEAIRQIQTTYYDYLHSKMDEGEVKKFIDNFKIRTNITKGHYFRGVL